MWRRWQDATPEGGFDAVIGNPPWDRIKLQEVEWFATRDPELARAPTAAARREGIRRLRELDDPLAHAFDQAKARADRLGQVVRASGHYPLLGGGDINLYSLFVERSLRLVKPGGLVGLLTPSGIYADKTAARFFKSVSTTGRVAGIYDFENRRLGTDLPPFFADIDSRFKFCALIVGGPQRRSRRPTAASSYPTPKPSPTPTAPLPSRLTTSPASTPTPAPPPSSAPAATPTSPAASTRTTPCWWTAQATKYAKRGRYNTYGSSMLRTTPTSFAPQHSSRLMASIQCKQTVGKEARNCIYLCTRERWPTPLTTVQQVLY